MLILVALLAAPQVWMAFKYDPSAPENVKYYGVSLEHKISYGALYLALAAYLAVMSHDVHEMLAATRPLFQVYFSARASDPTAARSDRALPWSRQSGSACTSRSIAPRR
jgi:hypothetical protein